MKKELKYNGYVNRAVFVSAEKSEIIIELYCVRKVPKGKRYEVGNTRTTMRLILDAYDVTAIAKAGAQGLRKLVEEAQSNVRSARTWVEQLKSIAEDA